MDTNATNHTTVSNSGLETSNGSTSNLPNPNEGNDTQSHHSYIDNPSDPIDYDEPILSRNRPIGNLARFYLQYRNYVRILRRYLFFARYQTRREHLSIKTGANYQINNRYFEKDEVDDKNVVAIYFLYSDDYNNNCGYNDKEDDANEGVEIDSEEEENPLAWDYRDLQSPDTLKARMFQEAVEVSDPVKEKA